MKRKLYYLASPYTHELDSIKKERFEKVQHAAVVLLTEAPLYTFSPIAYNHPMCSFDLPGDWPFWEEYDKAFIDHSDGLIVLTLDGWDKSVGVKAEIEYSKEIGIPVYYISYEEILNKDFTSIQDLL